MTTLALWVLVGCGVNPPAGIPDSPGTIKAAELADLVSVGSPDVPWLFWESAETLYEQDWRACPTIYAEEDSLFVDASGGCVDSTGVAWSGTLSERIDDDGGAFLTLNGFGADDGAAGWRVDGTIRVDALNDSYSFDSTLSVTSLAGDAEYLMWVDSTTVYVEGDDATYADRTSGTVGLADWGTATFEGTTLPLALSRGCGFANHFAGRLAFTGANSAEIVFTAPMEAASLPPPADTGTSDTGTSDTGTDTGFDTGGADTGADTAVSDTGDTDTGADTASDTGDTGEAENEGVDTCGECAVGTIDTTDLADCVEPGHPLVSPFPDPF